MASISLQDISKQWDSTTALASTTLDIASGSFTVLLGPSGCGKSTTLRLIAGLESPSSGRLLIDGRDVTDLPPAQRRIAMVFQNYALFPHLSVADNIVFGLQVRKASRTEQQQRLRDVAALVGLNALLERKPGQLSGGQQQRVALARALVSQAPVCLMDEPLSNLDAQLRQEMRRELRELQQRLKLTLVYVTHDQAEAMSMADQVVLLNKGRIEQVATPRELYARPASCFAARFIGTPPMNLAALQDGAIRGNNMHLGAPGAARWLGLRPEAVSLQAPTGDRATDCSVPAQVQSVEYLGADAVLRCSVGDQTLTVRTPGAIDVAVGAAVTLNWPSAHSHWFDAEEHRIPPAN
ncbi:MAG: ABC transporter ATP-binding protein [Burkholderiaceae bacterium]